MAENNEHKKAKEQDQTALNLGVTFNFSVNISKPAAVLAALANAGSAQVDPSSKPFRRAEATKIIGDARRIVNPGGVERLEKVSDRRDRSVGVDPRG